MGKKYDENIESSYLEYLDANNLYGWAMSQKLPVDGFKRVKDLSKFNESFIKNYDENSDKGYFIEVDVKYQKKVFISCIVTYHFYQKERKSEDVTSLFVPYKTKKAMLFTKER